PVGGEVQIDADERSQETAKAVWVPNRNGIFLNIAAAFAEGLGARIVLAGFNLEEAQTFPDNSQEYLDAATDALKFSTANQVKVQSYCASLTKTEIVKRAQELRLPFTSIWPCYFSGEEWCGQCESCQRFARAVREANFVGLDFDLSSPI
ncbi:MAG: 7-cyano-7-deazaguanine synthase, partial [Bdellovibrionales bacterium]|nr:7-cyano-7-deazaguanine synthase [Bdellovibrionales bacterium]